tara:strand:- start:7010 stop:7405 length:396 start_codon:yes stop_codon:yes gene_type:complete
MLRVPHMVFAAIWLTWYAAVITALFLPDRPIFGLIVLLIFLPIEATGVFLNTGRRDTFSEIITWVFVGQLSKHTRFLRGWNALLMLVVVTLAYLLGRTFLHYTSSPGFSFVVGGLTLIWLYDHFLSPSVHG